MKKLSKIYQELIKEDLEYAHVDDASPEADSFEIGAELTEDYEHNLTYDRALAISNEEKQKIQNLSAENIIINQGDYDGKSATLYINVPWDSAINDGNGINVNLEIIDGVLYQIHIFLSGDIRELGLGFKIYKALINDFGHIFAKKEGRINDTQIPRIWEKLSSESNITSYDNDFCNIAILDSNPDKNELLKKVGF